MRLDLEMGRSMTNSTKVKSVLKKLLTSKKLNVNGLKKLRAEDLKRLNELKNIDVEEVQEALESVQSKFLLRNLDDEIANFVGERIPDLSKEIKKIY